MGLFGSIVAVDNRSISHNTAEDSNRNRPLNLSSKVVLITGATAGIGMYHL